MKQTINVQSPSTITPEEVSAGSDKVENIIVPESNSIGADKFDTTVEESVVVSKTEKIRKISTETQTLLQTDEDDFITIPEPLKKLEAKFKNTMEQVAELTDEKQRLEHLVLQLQGETETIGVCGIIKSFFYCIFLAS